MACEPFDACDATWPAPRRPVRCSAGSPRSASCRPPTVRLVDVLHLPHRTTRYSLARLGQLREQLTAWTGRPIGGDELGWAIQTRNRHRTPPTQVPGLRRGRSPRAGRRNHRGRDRADQPDPDCGGQGRCAARRSRRIHIEPAEATNCQVRQKPTPSVGSSLKPLIDRRRLHTVIWCAGHLHFLRDSFSSSRSRTAASENPPAATVSSSRPDPPQRDSRFRRRSPAEPAITGRR